MEVDLKPFVNELVPKDEFIVQSRGKEVICKSILESIKTSTSSCVDVGFPVVFN